MMSDFISRGHEVIAIGNEFDEKWRPLFEEKGIRYISAKIKRNSTNPIADMVMLKDLKRILRDEKPDIVFTYQAKTVIYGNLAAHAVGISNIYSLIAGIGSIFSSDSFKSRLLHAILACEYRDALKYAKKIFFQNREDEAFFKKIKAVNTDNTVIINGSGVNLDVFTEMPLPRDPVFLCTARIIRDKGIPEYLAAARIVKKEYPHARFLLVGPYDSNPSALDKSELDKYIKDNTVEYFGEQNDVRPFLAECGIFVLPSHREGTPKSVLEAMACGRAIITTDAVGCRETVTDGVNGLLVPVNDVSALADKMKYLIDHTDEVARMAAESRKIAEEKYDVRIINRIICDSMNIANIKEYQYGTLQ